MTTRNVLIALAGATVVAGAVACGGTTTSTGSSQSPTATTASTTTEAPVRHDHDDHCRRRAVGVRRPRRTRRQRPELHRAHRRSRLHHRHALPGHLSRPTALTAILVRQRDQFVQAVTEPPVRDVAKALDIKPTTYSAPTLRTESLVLEEYVNVGGAHPETYYEALNYDLGTWKPITFDTLFKPGADPVAVLDPIVENELKNRLQGAPVDANPIGAEMYKNFALTDDAVIFFIGQGMWTIEAAGAQQVSVPRSELASILA